MKIKAVGLLLLFLLFSLPLTVYGESATDESKDQLIKVSIPDVEKNEFKKVWSRLGTNGDYLMVEVKASSTHESAKQVQLLTYDNSVVTLNNTVFENATDKSRKNAIGLFLRELQDSKVSGQTQQNIFNAFAAANRDVSLLLIPVVMDSTSADLFTSMKWISPLLPIVRVIFGIGSILIIMLLVGSTVIDLAFIGLPFARELMAKKENGENGRVRFVTSEAQSVIQETEASLGSGDGVYKNAYMLYFRRRALTYIILSICLLYLIAGEIGGLIAWLLKLGSGVV